MRILVTGSSGLLGSRFIELYPHKDQLLTPSHSELDITNLDQVKEFLTKTQPDVLVNFVAHTNVSEGENQRGDKEGLAWNLNVNGVSNLLSAINPENTFFLQISTDNVFSGLSEDPGPYSEDHQPETDSTKLTWYGFTKAEAERLIFQKGSKNTTILRITYPVRAHFPPKLDYLRKHLQLFDQGKLYPLFPDQQMSISFIDEVCTAISIIVDKRAIGIYHACSSNSTSPYELIGYLLKKVRGQKDIANHLLNDYIKTVPNPVRYPIFGGLKVEKTEKALGLKFSTWQSIVDQLIAQGISY